MLKRFFDFIFAIATIIIVFPLLICCWLLSSIDTTSNGLFIQTRIGQYGKAFRIYKLRTMNIKTHEISLIGGFLRKWKLDELPQLVNVLKGDMSIVGPRPDISGYYDMLKGEDRNILELKPGLTSMATVKYAKEEELLAKESNSLQFNDTVIFPDKVRMNLEYYYKHSFFGDLKIIWRTMVALFK